MTGPTIRPGTVHDAERISRLLVALSEEFVVPDFSPQGRAHFLGELAVSEMERRLSGDFRFYLAEDAEALAGVVAIRGTTHLYYLFIAKPHQGTGLARRLWLHAMKESLARGAPSRFTVNASNFAVAAYERLGFRRTEPMRERSGVLYNPMELIAGD
ncbi:MAG: GNAT family N-acetyltransferase [Betaproteobacteria bacterium]|jgi:GNAT superfamily N-acetyltransferase|nr:GNAT family N-acetyltransferase [Betaproteobacteria bacterium]